MMNQIYQKNLARTSFAREKKQVVNAINRTEPVLLLFFLVFTAIIFFTVFFLQRNVKIIELNTQEINTYVLNLPLQMRLYDLFPSLRKQLVYILNSEEFVTLVR